MGPAIILLKTKKTQGEGAPICAPFNCICSYRGQVRLSLELHLEYGGLGVPKNSI